MAALTSAVRMKAPRCWRRRVSSAKPAFDRFEQEGEVGVKCKRQRRRFTNQSWMIRVLCVAALSSTDCKLRSAGDGGRPQRVSLGYSCPLLKKFT
jgi:hypothetical protein